LNNNAIYRRPRGGKTGPPSFANPFALMRRLSEEMDRAFSTSWGLSKEMGAWCPAVEVTEHEANLEVSADLPGLTKDDVKVECTAPGRARCSKACRRVLPP
jgi:HSP20 family molecular chaperone IbpA